MADDTLSLKKMLVASWGYLSVLAFTAWAVFSWSFAWAVLVGGIISITSFSVSYRDVMVLFDSMTGETGAESAADTTKQSKKGFILKFWLRIFLIGLVLLVLIKWVNINVFGLIVGLTTIVFTIIVSAFGVVWRYHYSRR